MTANSNKSKQGNKAAHRVIAGVLCGASVLSLVLSLVMPPISQAIANDAQTVSTEETVMGGGSSSESTDVDNTTNGDTENQNSDETEGGETSGDAATAGLSSDGAEAEGAEQPADDGANDENEVMSAAADGSIEISNETQLRECLQNGGSYCLAKDITYDGQIDIRAVTAVLNLNGHKIWHNGDGNNYPLFNVHNGANFTIQDLPKEDLPKVQDQKSLENGNKNGNLAKLDYKNGTPIKLTYYVTESSVNAEDNTLTTETTYKHEVDIAGAIVGTAAGSTMKLINVYEGGTFNLQSGVLTTTKDANVGSLVYAENGSTVNISGGYVCGATSMSQGAGIELGVKDGKGATLNLTGGVIAGNYAPNGGGVYANGSTVNVNGGIISGNGTFNSQSGYGAGICALGSTVNVTSGYITNNKYQFYQDTETSWTHKGFGCHGGGGIAAYNGGSLQISGGYITGNYSAEAGGGVYAGYFHQPLNTFTFSGGTIASNVADHSEGGGVRIAAPTVGTFNVSDQKAYITNNETKTTNDWGGGGIFVQGGGDWKEGNSSTPVASAKLHIYNTLIKKNHAEGYGGGFAACPSGKTAITDTKGIAIFGNSDANGAHLSGGTNGKNEDQPSNVEGGKITDAFKSNGHKDLFLIRKSDNDEYVAAVTGQMLGGGAANWKGTIDDVSKSIGKYEGAQAKYMIGLDANPSDGDQGLARDNAKLFITGNTSNIHGGGIMTNGDVVAGSTKQVKVYPKMKLNGTKELTGRTLKEGEFNFQLLKQGADKKAPSFGSDGTLQPNGCSVVGTVKNDVNGNFAFNLSEVYADDDLVYYLVEVPGADKDVNYDKTIYKIDPKVVKDGSKSHKVLDIEYTYYTVNSVQITTIAANGVASDATVYPTPEGDVASVALTDSKTFTNTYTKYDSKGSWIPKATKVVEGGEMKEFTLQLAADVSFQKIIHETKTTGDNKKQTLSFLDDSGKGIEYSLSDIIANPDTAGDPTGRGASKTFTYYVREKTDGSWFSHYKYDQSVYKITVNATDKSDNTIECDVSYTKIVDAEGKDIAEADQETHPYGEDTSAGQSLPTFTNTYSTSLPLSGMSGVTLTYLAGAAVLCAAAAWMHIRRKANAKGGERRE